VLTPGIYNSAYFEHSFLADQMGAELVRGPRPLSSRAARSSCARPGPGAGRRHLPPHRRRLPRSADLPAGLDAGRAGLFDAYRAGNVTLVNAPGTGIADDKAVYTYVPEIIEFYLGEEPMLKNVPTYNCANEDERAYVLENLDELVVKEVHGSGGYGMLVGPTPPGRSARSSREKIEARPDNYIVQPTLALSTCPTFVKNGIAPRHVDLRPFVLVGDRNPHHARRPDARGAQEGLAGGQFLARAAAPRTPGCWRTDVWLSATSSGPRTWRACSRSATA
jgi:uncharacterized circularly permuted ATP-grasp superfamily protein